VRLDTFASRQRLLRNTATLKAKHQAPTLIGC
jgi:hypothetical protein